jgi:hypothetical protein
MRCAPISTLLIARGKPHKFLNGMYLSTRDSIKIKNTIAEGKNQGSEKPQVFL